MTSIQSDRAEQVFHEIAKRRLMPMADHRIEPLLNRQAIEAILPHRDPFLFVDQVVGLDLERGIIAARYALSGARAVFAGHFPRNPIWPGVLQVEAIGQTGIILCLNRANISKPSRVILTQVLGARFMRPVTPNGEVELIAHVFEEGLFFTIVGQCLYNEQICSVAAITILLEEDTHDPR